MARIRTVKPELWTDPEFTECSLSARLLFIAMLNFASDYGVLPDKPRQLKMQCLPADNCDIDALLDELIEHRFLVRREAPCGENVLVIRTFSKNQKINRPSKGRYGDPAEWGNTHEALTEPSVKPHGGPPPGRDNSEGKGRDSSDPVITSPYNCQGVVDNAAGRIAKHREENGWGKAGPGALTKTRTELAPYIATISRWLEEGARPYDVEQALVARIIDGPAAKAPAGHRWNGTTP